MFRAFTYTGLLALAAMLHATAAPAQDVKPDVKPGVKTAKPEVCVDGKCTGEFGTSLQFEATPKDAAKKAQKEEKLVLVLHVSGNFEDPTFT